LLLAFHRFGPVIADRWPRSVSHSSNAFSTWELTERRSASATLAIASLIFASMRKDIDAVFIPKTPSNPIKQLPDFQSSSLAHNIVIIMEIETYV
jgi:hypothetical protein